MIRSTQPGYSDYLAQVNHLLETRYGITTEDCGEEWVMSFHTNNESAAECVQIIAEKYDLPNKATALEQMRRHKIAEQNDRFRQQIGIPTFHAAVPGHATLTPGITALLPVQQMTVVAMVRDFADFNGDNDPYNEHDFGAFDLLDIGRIFWKIDLYDNSLRYYSAAPSDPVQTFRVLTIMLASEY